MAERARQLFRGSVALLIENSERELLMVQQAKPEKGFGWSLPAGGIDPGEGPVEAALREGKEELGREVNITALARHYTLEREGSTNEAFAYIFWADFIPLDSLVLPPKEILRARYIGYPEIVKMDAAGELYKPLYNRQTIRDWYFEPRRFDLGAFSAFISLDHQAVLTLRA